MAAETVVVATAMNARCFPSSSRGLTVRHDVLLSPRVEGHFQGLRGGGSKWSSYTCIYVGGERAHADSIFFVFFPFTCTAGMQCCEPKMKNNFSKKTSRFPISVVFWQPKNRSKKNVNIGQLNPTEKPTEKRLFGFRFAVLLVCDPVCATTPRIFCSLVAMGQG